MVLISFMNSSYNKNNMDIGVFLGVVITILCVIETGIVSDIVGKTKPSALDVYQGKTTIEYTIRDGVKVDSVVVWKDQKTRE